jgi:elongation factor 3
VLCGPLLLPPPHPLQEALGALAAAIKSFDGGVLLISHNSEFTSTCASETWRVADGQVVISREAPPGPSN